MNFVSWFDAKAFAEWVGGRLPSEAEWEYAARGQGEDQSYPWGHEDWSCQYADGLRCNGDGTSSVCATPAGNSAQGICDLSGNVVEWLMDHYHNSYRGAPRTGQPWCDTDECADNGRARVVRGGGWNSPASGLTATNRSSVGPSGFGNSLGFRVAR